jgi:hypothetical protein
MRAGSAAAFPARVFPSNSRNMGFALWVQAELSEILLHFQLDWRKG